MTTPPSRYMTRSRSGVYGEVSSAGSSSSSVVSKRTKIRIPSKAFDVARECLFAFQQQDEEVDMELSELILAENVSLQSYIQYLEGNPKPPVKICLAKGKIKAYELSLDEHATIVGMLGCVIRDWTNHLLSLPGLDIVMGPDSMRQGDLCFRPKRRPRPPAHLQCNKLGMAYPTMVVEIGCSEDLFSLHELAQEYFSLQTTIQIYLAIKVYSRYPNGTMALIALLYQRTNANPLIPRAISFGTRSLHHTTMEALTAIGVQPIVGASPPPNLHAITGVGFGGPACNAAGIPGYQLNIPAALLFDGNPSGIPAELAGGLDLDLFVIQDEVNDLYR